MFWAHVKIELIEEKMSMMVDYFFIKKIDFSQT